MKSNYCFYDNIRYIVPGSLGLKKYELVKVFYPLEIKPALPDKDSIIDFSEKYIIVKGDAGSGKTTFLKRLYIFFLQIKENKEYDVNLSEKYRLTQGYTPILVKLRTLKDYDDSFKKVLTEQGGINGSTVLLLDGMDEVPDVMRLDLLKQLNTLIQSFPEMRIIISGRGGGFDDDIVSADFRHMGFREVQIMPLTDSQISEYVEIRFASDMTDHTDEHYREKLYKIMGRLNKGFCSDIMRRPLELDIVLDHLSEGEELYFSDRSDIFKELLSGILGRHELPDDRECVCSDLFNLLGLLSFYSMVDAPLHADGGKLNKVYEETGKLTFCSDIIRPKSLEDLKYIFNRIAKNTGILEVIPSVETYEEYEQKTDERIIPREDYEYSFPIRSYQEFLCAYACCNLCLDGEGDTPDPFYYVTKYVNDSLWQGTISFILADMERKRHKDLKEAVSVVFETMESESGIKAVIDSGIEPDMESALKLCKRFFKMCHPWDSELLFSCIDSPFSNIWKCALRDLFHKNIDSYMPSGDCRDVFKPYLTAYVFVLIVSEPEKIDPADLIQNDRESCNMVGAYEISVLTAIYLDEMMPEMKNIAAGVLNSLNNIPVLIKEKAEKTNDFVYIKALSDLWVSGCRVSDEAGKACSEDMVMRLSEMIDRSEAIFLETWYLSMDDSKDMFNADATATLISTLGSLPLSSRLLKNKIKNLNSYAFIRGQFMYLGELWKIERIGSAFAMIYCFRDEEMFKDIWEVMVKEIADSEECGQRGCNIYMLQTGYLEKLNDV